MVNVSTLKGNDADPMSDSLCLSASTASSLSVGAMWRAWQVARVVSGRRGCAEAIKALVERRVQPILEASHKESHLQISASKSSNLQIFISSATKRALLACWGFVDTNCVQLLCDFANLHFPTEKESGSKKAYSGQLKARGDPKKILCQ